MPRIPDNYDLWKKHDKEQAESLKKCPKCDFCGEPIQEEVFYNIFGIKICVGCLENVKEYTEYYEEG